MAQQKPWTRSPWVTIWLSPKETFGKILRYKKHYLWAFFSTVVGLNYVSYLLSAGISNFTGWARLFAALLTVVLSPLLAFAFFRIGGWIMAKVGLWFKGKADVYEATTVFIWSNVPALLYLALWVINLLIARGLGASVILGNIPLMAVIAHYPTWALLNYSISLVLSVWSVIIYVCGISYVHQFSIPRAIGTFLIATAFNIIIFSVLSSLFVFLLGIIEGLIL